MIQKNFKSKLFLIGFFIFFIQSISFSDEIIHGNFCYNYGDNESLLEARDTAKALAIREAIQSYKIIVKSLFESKIKETRNNGKIEYNSVTNDLLQTIATGHLKNIKVLKHTEKGRKICYTIQGSVEPTDIRELINDYIKNIPENETFTQKYISDNGYLQILNSNKKEKQIDVVVRALETTPFKSDYHKVFMDCFDSKGNLVGGNSQHVDHLLTRGEIRVITFERPNESESCKVWLYKVE